MIRPDCDGERLLAPLERRVAVKPLAKTMAAADIGDADGCRNPQGREKGMPTLNAVLIAVHLLAAVVWVGGMAFAYTVLRPSVDATLEPPQKLAVLAAVFRRFFVWVWHAVVLLPLTGYIMLAAIGGGFAGSRPYIHLMQGLGWVMIVLFIAMVFGPYRPFRRAVAAADWPEAARHLPRVRRIIGINLVLGLITVAVGATGRFL
jgi:uncharacterized membrane protein